VPNRSPLPRGARTNNGIYMSDSSSRATATASVPGFVRNLGAFEEIYWLYNQLGAHGFAYAMEVDGPTIVAEWQSALDAIQRSHPFFSVCIEPNGGGVPFFRHVDGAPIPLRVVDGMSGPRWQEEMAREIFTPFAGDAAPLLRATLIHEANRAVFILAAHHTISDGVSMAAALCDLFHVLAGGTIELHPIIPPMEESLGVPRAQLNEPPDAPPPAGPPLVYRGPDNNPPRIETLKLDAALTNQLVARARSENTTVHGALCSAVVRAGRMFSEAWRQKPVRVLSNINVRRDTEVGNSSALYFAAGITPVEPENTEEFWPLARRFTDALPAQRSRGALQFAAKAMTQTVLQGLDVEGAQQFLAQGMPFEVIISNIGRLNFDGRLGDLHLRSVWGMSSITGWVDEQIVGVVTVNEQLHMTYTSQTSIPSLLPAIEQLLREACHIIA
jgi:Condensation domain